MLSNALASGSLRTSNKDITDLQDALTRLEALENRIATLHDDLSELKRHRHLSSDCGFTVDDDVCHLTMPLEVDKITINGKATFKDDVEFAGSKKDLKVEGSATFHSDVTFEDDLDVEDTATFKRDVTFDDDVEIKKKLEVKDLKVTGDFEEE